MKLAISNIAWNNHDDNLMHSFLKEIQLNGVEIAPTRWFQNEPYEHLEDASNIAKSLYKDYALTIPSMQSIWFGIDGNIFNVKDIDRLILYTKKAILFAETINCKNIVFGCPKNRNLPEGIEESGADNFFLEIADYAVAHNTCIALEPNPTIYNTNFINTTTEAFQYVKRLNHKGLKVNVDIGTIIYNNESLSILSENISLINHIHISEPNLECIKERNIHKELACILKAEKYKKYISIEMKNPNDLHIVREVVRYAREVFCEI